MDKNIEDYKYTPEANISKYKSLDAESRAVYFKYDEKMSKATQNFAYDFGKILIQASRELAAKGKVGVFTFSDWLDSWGLSKKRVYQLIDYANYIDKIKGRTDIDSEVMIDTFNTLPKNLQQRISKDVSHQEELEKLLLQRVETSEPYKRILNELDEKKSDLAKTRAENEQIAEKNQELQQKNLNLTQTSNQIQNELIEVQKKLHKAETENYQLRNQPAKQIQVPPQDYSAIKRLNQQYRQELIESSKREQELKKLLAESPGTTEVEKLKKELNRIKKEKTELEKEISKDDTEKRKASVTIQSLQVSLKEMTQQLQTKVIRSLTTEDLISLGYRQLVELEKIFATELYSLYKK